MAPLQTNATLEAVASAGNAPDWDQPGAAGAQKWAGAIRCYYRRKIQRVVAAGGASTDVVLERRLIVDTDDLDALIAAGLDTDDTVTFTPDGQPQEHGTATLIDRADLAGISASLRTSRIELEPA